MSLLLSIIIPCFNVERYIDDTLKMLLAQELTNCEIIIVNDGSLDGTEDILSAYQAEHEDIHVIHQDNQGVSAARNEGLARAQGKYIYFFDADDKLEPQSIAYMIDQIKVQGNRDIYAFGYISEEDGKRVKTYTSELNHKKTLTDQTANQLFLTKRLPLHICSIVCRAEFLRKNELYFAKGIPIGEDVEYLLRILSKADSLYYDKRICFRYQIHEDGVMQGYKHYSVKQYESFLLNVRTIQSLRNKNTERDYNYFLANSYVSNLWYYMRSDFADASINKGFLKYRSILKKKIPAGNRKNFLFIKLMRLVPLRLILMIRKRG